MAFVSLLELKLARELQLKLSAPTLYMQTVTGSIMPVLGEFSSLITVGDNEIERSKSGDRVRSRLFSRHGLRVGYACLIAANDSWSSHPVPHTSFSYS